MEIRINQSNTINIPTEFTYKRYVGGYPVDGDLITINLNNSDGSIYNYTRELDKIPDITTPKNIISKTDAKDTYLKNSNFGLLVHRFI